MVLKYVHNFFDPLPFKRWSLIPLPLSVGCTMQLAFIKQDKAQVMVCDIRDKLLRALWLIACSVLGHSVREEAAATS